ncbi:MAG TPA: GNAT family N-acetyltransferase [Ideonella sp.]|uniref:GNAT family N-acetyltransferase n=1 Tax=Ideonella sp. TaxID=1929293 RepID=UPI002E308A3B|nr:GNAT family N-acetyltransferase [Ideonella sp.]HEX5682536.1 GNAT family N-acetyltransferase [Ideonella sp.]
MSVRVSRLGSGERDTARALFALLAEVFDEPHQPRADQALDELLARQDFWALAASDDTGRLLGGLTAHRLPMTHHTGSALFIYDIAVLPAAQRQGVGLALVSTLRTWAAQQAIADVFVFADNEDAHALDFYRALGGRATAVTMFDFGAD